MMPMIIVIATLSLGSILDAGFDQIFNLYNPLVYSTGISSIRMYTVHRC